jgi:anti-sigma factor RsiW
MQLIKLTMQLPADAAERLRERLRDDPEARAEFAAMGVVEVRFPGTFAQFIEEWVAKNRKVVGRA